MLFEFVSMSWCTPACHAAPVCHLVALYGRRAITIPVERKGFRARGFLIGEILLVTRTLAGALNNAAFATYLQNIEEEHHHLRTYPARKLQVEVQVEVETAGAARSEKASGAGR